MIGQKHNLEMIDKWVASGCPHFFCIVGQRGSGKRMLANYIASKLEKSVSEVGIKVDDVREVIDSSSRYGGFYVFADADTMSTNAKNALLKITEEPPKDSYFVVTVQDESSLLDTIRSRAQVIRMDPYTVSDLAQYGSKHPESEILRESYNIAATPYDLDMLVSYGEEFIDYINLVIDNIRDVEPANAFKSSNRLALKGEEDKYDLGLFFKAVSEVLSNRIKSGKYSTEDVVAYSRMRLLCVIGYTKTFQLGVNRQHIYDNWIFDVRAI